MSDLCDDVDSLRVAITWLARLHDHAEFLRKLKEQLSNDLTLEGLARLSIIADDMDPGRRYE